MRLPSRIAASIVLTSISAAQLSAQPRSALDETVEPFSIRKGSTFSATGGSIDPKIKNKSYVRSISDDITDALRVIRQNHVSNPGRHDPTNLLNNSLSGALRSLDPHSKYYDAIRWKELLDDQISEYSGIGATISSFEKDGLVETFILSVASGSPAERARLAFGDKIVAINGEQMTGRQSDEVRDKIRGGEGSLLKLTIERGLTLRLKNVEIRRGRVTQPLIPHGFLLNADVGYVDLSEGFHYGTAAEFGKAVTELKGQGMTSLIIDLRGNGGGIVEQAVKIVETFVPAGTTIATQRGRGYHDNKVWKSTNPSPETMPLVVLVDEYTASAAEIVAGAFQDEDRALIVGEKTFGKGLVQSVIDLPGRSGLTLTTARYMTPAGRSIQRDYSSIDLYDYYNKKRPSAGIDKAFFEARTITDRRVFGGDGILPDEPVKSETLNATQVALIDPIFFFAREVITGQVAGNENYRSVSFSYGKRIGSGDFLVSDSQLAAFNSFVERKYRGRFAEGTLRDETVFIRLRVRYYLAMASLGAGQANQVLIEDDPQVAKGVRSLPSATDLAQSAAKAKRQLK